MFLPVLSPGGFGIARVALAVYLFLGASSLVTLLHPRLRRPEGLKVRQAINTWWFPALFCGAMVLFGTPVAVPLNMLLCAGALREFLRLVPAADRHPLLDGMAYAAVVLHFAQMVVWPQLPSGALLLLWSLGVLPLVRAAVVGPEGWLGASARLAFGLLLTVLALGYLSMIFLATGARTAAAPAALALLLMVLVMTSDAGQYLAGKLFGQHKLAPRISPNKTHEGLAGGALITAVVAAAAAPVLTPLSPLVAALLGVALCGLGLLGDLMISTLKRDGGVKDSGTLLPGQGGLLDRCDSLLLTAPLYYYVVVPWLR